MDELRRYLNGLGACGLKDSVDSPGSAVRMLFTPQGREFAIKTGFPTLAFLREHREELNAIRGIHIDKGPVMVQDRHEVLAAGDTAVTFFADKPEAIYKVMAMHGATINIHAREFAVVTATEIGGNINVVNDGTAKITIER